MPWIRQVPFLHRSFGPNEINTLREIVLLKSFKWVGFECSKTGLLHHRALPAICVRSIHCSRMLYDYEDMFHLVFFGFIVFSFISMTSNIKLWGIKRMEIKRGFRFFSSQFFKSRCNVFLE